MPSNYDDAHGLAFFEAQQIVVRRESDPADALDTLLHEALHGEFPDLSEDAIRRVATHFTDLLIKLDLVKLHRLRKKEQKGTT
jgi:hypothetical protein